MNITSAPSVGSHELRPFTDLGNAERLVDDHGLEVRYVAAWKTWLVWDGTRWRRDDTQEITRRAKQTVRGIVREVVDLTTSQLSLPPDEQLPTRNLQAYCDAILSHAAKSEADGKIRAMLNLAQSHVALSPEALDADPWLFNCANGVVDLRTGELHTHDPAYLLTKRSDVKYDPDADCPRWLQFLDTVFEEHEPLIKYVQRAIGYTLSGVTSEQVLHLMHGAGQNGKTTFLETVGAVLGEYGVSADFTSFIDGKHGGPREDLARLAGARLVRSSEIGEGKRLNEPLIKSLTGEDKIAARFLYSGTFEFRPQFKLWLSVNHKPVIRGTDLAIWRRIRLVPFLVTIPLDDRDPHLASKLTSELSGILAWSVRGGLDWQAEGLRAPGIVQDVGDKYRAESDVLGHFLEECCELGPAYYEGSGTLYDAFKHWADENREGQLTMTMFGRKLEERGHVMSKSNGVKRRHGLKLRAGVPTTNGQKPWFT